MLSFHDGGSQEDGPPVGNGGNCEGARVVVSSHDCEHDGVKTVVRAAIGTVSELDMLALQIDTSNGDCEYP